MRLVSLKARSDSEEGEGINLEYRGHCFERVEGHPASGGFEVVHMLGIDQPLEIVLAEAAGNPHEPEDCG
ncbi:hypothetical protein RK21_02003 [Pseudomonas plecoglossicida]|nr:hypothetical protein RK21_02003 [Pseudomonas plecoglossicida]